MRDLGILILRLTFGGLLAAHGSQKLFGMFEGHGLEGTGQFFESLGFQPGKRWAFLAGLGEFGGGMLTAVGFLHPVGPITTLAPMAVAWGRVHWGKPIWVSSGGAELPMTNMAIAAALALLGPGKFSLDRLFGILPHPALAMMAGAAVAAGTLMALNQPRPEPQLEQTGQQEQPADQSTESQPEPVARNP
jgi:putative oxidoreductase